MSRWNMRRVALGLLSGLTLACAADASGPRAAATTASRAAVAGGARELPSPPAAPPDPRTCPCYGTGDLNGSGVVTAGDAQHAWAIAMNFVVPTPAERCAADCDGDGTVTVADAQGVFDTVLSAGHCPRDLPGGACCEAGAHCATGTCLNGSCCGEGDCCATAADCPPGYASPPRCDEPPTCQGSRRAAICYNGACQGVVVGDDSACDATFVTDPCGLFRSAACTGAPEQGPPECLTHCTADTDCDPGIACVAGQCEGVCVRRVVAASTAPAPDGLTWDSAFPSITAGLDAAERAVADGAPDCEVWVSAGTYRESLDFHFSVRLRPHVHLYGGFAGYETVRDERDWEANVTTIHGQDHNFHVVTGTNDATLDGFTVRDGAAHWPYDPPDAYGGGLLNIDASPRIANCRFVGNVAWDRGGAIYNERSSPIIDNCLFEDNESTDGGAICNLDRSWPVITRSTFLRNEGEYGGAILVRGLSCGLTLRACTFRENEAGVSGGAVSADSRAALDIRDCHFRDNRAERNGGAVVAQYGSGAYVEQSVFSGNAAPDGAGLYAGSFAEHTVLRSVFLDNAGTRGGAVNATLAHITFVDCMFRGNWALHGAALYATTGNDGAGLTVVNATFADNVAVNQGGALYAESPVAPAPTVVNAILWGNRPGPLTFTGFAPTITYSAVEGGYAGEGNLDADPRFVDGPNGDLHLQAGSPCIDRGDGAAASAADLDGNPRCDDPDTPNLGSGEPPFVDIGAYEYQAPGCE